MRGVGQRVVPALVETAIGLGNAGVTAVTQVTAAPSFVTSRDHDDVTQLGRAVPPVVEESAAHMHHMVSEHIAPAAKASMQVKFYK